MKEQIALEFMKVIAPVMVQEGLKLQNRLVEAGRNPENCTTNGKDIPHAYAETAKVWAIAFTDAWMND